MAEQHSTILVITEEESTKELLEPVLQRFQHIHFTFPYDVTKEIDRLSPDILLIYHLQNTSNDDLIFTIHTEHPNCQLFFISDTEDFEMLRDVTRAGAIDFFILPEEQTILIERIEKVSQLLQQQNEMAATQTFKRGRGKVLSFYSGKGGEGRTLLASTFAQTLKLESTAKVVLIDLNLQFGGVESVLGLESNHSFVDLLPVANELNENHIRNVVDKERYTELDLLLSPRDAETAESIHADFVSKVIRACRRSYDFIIIDLPSEITEITYAALDESDLIYYVMNLNSLSLQVYKQVEMLFKRLNIDTTEQLELVVNKISKENELKVSDMKNFIQATIASEVRLDHKGVQLTINQGEPLRRERGEKKLSPVAKDIRKWVLSII